MDVPKRQYVVQTATKRTGWGWESYFDSEAAAINRYKAASKDKAFSSVRIYWQGWDTDGNWRTGPVDIQD